MTREEMCKEFCKLNGIHWHEWDGKSWSFNKLRKCFCGDVYFKNPTFPDAKSILGVLMKRDDQSDFIRKMFSITEAEYYSYVPEKRLIIFDKFLDMVMNPDKLLTAALDWCREHPCKEIKCEEEK